MPDPFDLANVISLDHSLADRLFTRLEAGEGIREVLLDKVVLFLSLHAGAEEAVFYPALAKHVDGGEELAEEDRAEHSVVKEALAVIQNGEPDAPEVAEALTVVIDAVRAHVPKEELEQLPTLRAAVGDEEMVKLGTEFQAIKAGLPTRAHPHAPDHRPANLANSVVAPIDQLRDKRKGRAALAATDGSGRLDAQAQELIDKLGELGLKPYEILEPKAARKLPTVADAVQAVLKDHGRPTDPEPVGEITDRIVDGPDGDLALRTYEPLNSVGGLLPVIVYFHGGGWVVADLDVYDATPRALANAAGAIVVSVAYRKAPEHPFPAAHDDALRATRWVLANAESFGGDPDRVAIAGESAGGNLAASTCIALLEAGEQLPVFQLLVYPVTAPTPRTESYPENADAIPLNPGAMAWFGHHVFAQPDDALDPRVSLLDVPITQLSGLPPAFVVTAEVDPLRDEGQLFADNLVKAGVRAEVFSYEGVPHEFFGTGAVVEQGQRAVADAAERLVGAFNAVPVQR